MTNSAALALVGVASIALGSTTSAGAQEEAEEMPPRVESNGQAPTPTWSGTLTTRYRGRWGHGTSDHDLTETLTVDYGRSHRDDWTAHLMVLGAYDLDGVDSEPGSDPFFSLQDSYDGRLFGRLHYGNVALHALDGFEILRIGRQLVYETPVTAHFDGALIETQSLLSASAPRVQLGAFLGVPVNPYESSPTGDAIGGVYAKAAPWEAARVRLEWMYLEDLRNGARSVNELLAATLRQSFEHKSSLTDLELRHSWIDGDDRDVLVALGHDDWEREFTLDARYYELFEREDNLAVPLDPFESTLLALFPFRQITLLGSKNTESLVFDGGVDVRRVSDSGDVGEFNRDLERYFLTTTLVDAFEGVSVSFTGEVWSSDDNDYETWGLDASRTFEDSIHGSLTASVGSYYSLFKYDLFAAQELERVRTYQTSLRYRFEDMPASASVRYELEDGDIGTFHRATVGLTWRF